MLKQTLVKKNKVFFLLLLIAFIIFCINLLLIKNNYYNILKSELNSTELQLRKMENKLYSKPAEGMDGNLTGYTVSEFTRGNDTDPAKAPDLMRISMIALETGVLITGYKPDHIITGAYPNRLPVELSLTGNYNKVVNFLTALEENIPGGHAELRELRLQMPESRDGKSQPRADGTAACNIILLYYLHGTGAGDSELPQDAATSWKVGRPNPFIEADLVSPYKGVIPMGHKHPDESAVSPADPPDASGNNVMVNKYDTPL